MKIKQSSLPLALAVAGFLAACPTAAVRGQSAASQPSAPPAASQPSDPPYKRVLTGEDQERVAELENRTDELRSKDKFDEAIPLAEEVLAIRRRVQGPDHWNAADAEREVKDLRKRAAMTPEELGELRDADRYGEDFRKLYAAGRYDEAMAPVRRQLEIYRRLLGDEDREVGTSVSNLAMLLHVTGDYAAAEQLHREAVALQRKILGNEHPNVARGLHNLAGLLMDKGDYAAAEPLQREALAMTRKLRGDEHPDVAASQNDLAAVLIGEGDSAAAESLLRAALATQRKLLGEVHEDVALTASNLATLLRKRGDYAAAEPLFREALAITRKLRGDEHPDVAHLLGGLALLLQAKGDLAEAERLQREALAIRRRFLGDEHPDVAASRNDLAAVLFAKGDYVAAEPLFREDLATHRKVLGNEHPQVARSLGNLGACMQFKGDYVGAEPLLREALAMTRKLRGDEHPEVADRLRGLASLLYEKGDYAAAEPLFREVLTLRRKALGNQNPEVAVSLNDVASLLLNEGNYAAAEPLFREALAMRRKLSREEDLGAVYTLNNLACLLQTKGDYVTAEPLLREALALRRKLLGDEHPAVAESLYSLAALLDAKGDFTAAEALFRESLVMRRKLLGEEHLEVAISLEGLSSLLCTKGDYAGSEPLVREAMAIRRKLVGDESPELAHSMTNLAVVLDRKGDHAAAEALQRQALAMDRKLRGDAHPRVAADLTNLAVSLTDRGDWAGAELLYREALEMNRKLLGEEHREVARDLQGLALLMHRKRDWPAAEPLYSEALTSLERQRTAIIGTEADRAAFAERLSLESVAEGLCEVRLRLGQMDGALGVLERGRSRSFLDLLARQDLDLVSEVLANADETTATELQRRLAQEESRRVELNAAEAALATAQRHKKITDEAKDKLIDERTAAVRKARRALADASAEVLAGLREVWPNAKPMTVGQIRDALRPGDVILTYNWRLGSLCALCVDSSARGEVHGAVVIDDQDEVREFRELLVEAKKQLSTQPTTDALQSTNACLAKLRQSLVDELPEAMRSQVLYARRLIVVPDGPLLGLPFDAVLGAGQSVEDARALPEIVYADSATLYVNRKREAESKKKSEKPAALVLGNPIFDRERIEPKYPDNGVLITQVAEGSNAAGAGLTRGDVILRYDGKKAADYQALVATLQAVGKAVESGDRPAEKRIPLTYWRDGKKHTTKVAPGKLGVALDQGDPKRGLELLAKRSRGEDAAAAEVSMLDQIRLHGGTLSPLPGTLQEAQAVMRVINHAGGATESLLGESATIRELESKVEGKQILHFATHGLTGSSQRPYDASLALTRPADPSPDDIGFLTLDHLIRSWRGKLKDCDLVVLSACDTQRGIARGDSVMALPWGFFYAGAPTVVASLWKVDDLATSILMEEFYRNLLERKMSKGKALQASKESLRTMTYDEARRRTQLSEDDFARYAQARGWGKEEAPKGERRTTAPYAHPYYWAAFVLIGSPE